MRLTASNGQVGYELVAALEPLGKVVALGRSELDPVQPETITARIRNTESDIIVNAEAYTAVDNAEAEQDLAIRVNVEDDVPAPLNAYGHFKLAGKQRITAAGCHHPIIRTNWLYAKRGTNFLLTIRQLVWQRQSLHFVDDQIGSATWARAGVSNRYHARRARLVRQTGHLQSVGHVSRYALAEEIIRLAIEASGIRNGLAAFSPSTIEEFLHPVAPPLNAAAAKEKFRRAFGCTMPQWTTQLRNCMRNLCWDWLHHPAEVRQPPV